MAGVLSGSLPDVNVGSHWRLSLDWTATQDIDANKSTITAKLYWEALDGYGAVYSSQTNDAAIQHDDGAWSIEGHSPALSANQKRLINTYQFTVTHDSDGTKTFSLDAYFDAQVTLGGTYYGTINMTQTNFTLKTIPRGSTLTAGWNWTAGSNTTFSIDRNSSSFTHDLDVYVADSGGAYHLIKTVTGIGTSGSSGFSGIGGDNEDIFGYLNGASSRDTKIVLKTRDSSGTLIATSSPYYGTVTAPAADTITVADFNIGSVVPITVTEKDSEFTVSITATIGSYTPPAIATKSTGLSFNWDTASLASSMYAQVTTATSKSITFTVTTYYGAKQVRGTTSKTVNAKVTNSNPTFTDFAYSDQNPTTAGITAPYQGTNDPYIIQNKSTLRIIVTNANKAQAKNSATITKYVFTVNGTPRTFNSPFPTDIIWDFGILNATGNINVTITAYDSRNLTVSKTKTVNVVPWSKPSIVASAVRTGGWQNETTLSISGSISPLKVNTTNANAIVNVTPNSGYSYGVQNGSQGGMIGLTGLSGMPNFTTTSVKINGTTGLDNTLAYTVIVTISDKLDSSTATITVPSGKPIFFIDDLLKSIGFGDYPANAGEFMMNGSLRFGNNLWATAGGALIMGNGDITQANGIWFSDAAETGNGEGLMFAKSGIVQGSSNKADYWNLLLNKDGWLTFEGGGSTPLTINNDLTFRNSGSITLDQYGNFKSPTGSTGNWSVANNDGTLMIQFYFAPSTPIKLGKDIDMNNHNLINVNQAVFQQTGDAIVLQSDVSTDPFNVGNLTFKSYSGTYTGRIMTGGTTQADNTMSLQVADESGSLDSLLELNASGANWAKVGGDLLPTSSNSRDLGSTSLTWANLYLANLGMVHWNNDDGLKYDDGTNTFTFSADNGANATVTCKTLTQTSDASLKKDFALPSFSGVDEINKMDIRTYEFITDDPTQYLGVVIGEFDGGEGYVNPLLKVMNPDGYATMNLYGLTSMNSLAIQELDKRLRKLEGAA